MPGPISKAFEGQSGDTPVVPSWLADDATLLMEELRATRDRLCAVLRACESYFEERADAEYILTDAGAHGNEEMALFVEIREELRRAK